MAGQSNLSCCCSLKAAMITYGVLIGVASIYQVVQSIMGGQALVEHVEREYHVAIAVIKDARYVVIIGNAINLLFMGLMFIPTCSEPQDGRGRGFLIPWIVYNILRCIGDLGMGIFYAVYGFYFQTASCFILLVFVAWGSALSITYYKSLTSSHPSNPSDYAQL